MIVSFLLNTDDPGAFKSRLQVPKPGLVDRYAPHGKRDVYSTEFVLVNRSDGELRGVDRASRPRHGLFVGAVRGQRQRVVRLASSEHCFFQF